MIARNSIFLTLTFMCAHIANAAQVGTVVQLEGSADVRRGDQPATRLVINAAIDEHDILRTKRNSYLIIKFVDGSQISLAENTKLSIAEYALGNTPRGVFDVARGKIRAVVTDTFSRNKESFKTRTTTAIAGVQGTDYEMHANANDTQVLVHHGVVAIRNFDSNISDMELLTAGTSAFVKHATAPVTIVFSDIDERHAKEKRAENRVNSGSTQDLRSSGKQIHDPISIAPNFIQRVPLPATPNLP